MEDTTSVRIGKDTLLWIKRLQGIMKYQGHDLSIDRVILTAVRICDYDLAKIYKLTEAADITTYVDGVNNQFKKQAEEKKNDIHLF